MNKNIDLIVKQAVIAFIGLTLCTGCILRRVIVDEVSPPIEHIAAQPREIALLDRDADAQHYASLGDTMFILDRYTLGEETIALIPPDRQKAFPKASTWSITHRYRETYIYTSPFFYKGRIGIMADADGRLSNGGLLMQVRGGKSGKTWRVESVSPGHAFYQPIIDRDTWGIRYGGKRGDATEFQIIDRTNPTVTQIIQSIAISDADLTKGFLVKGVLIRVTEQELHGAIKYKLIDTFSKKASQPLPSADPSPAPALPRNTT
jgi:hypothetical protein